MMTTRNLVVVLGDQLNPDSAALDGFCRERDAVWMAEASHEAQQVWSHKARIALFLSAMRHFRDALGEAGLRVCYHPLTQSESTLGDLLEAELARLQPERVVVQRASGASYRNCSRLERAGVTLERPTGIFTPESFGYAQGRSLRMEFFYRALRKRFGILMEAGEPAGGAWNYDADNRESLGAQGPQLRTRGPQFVPDAQTREVLAEVEERFAEHPGSLASFAWTVTRSDALRGLDAFIADRLPLYGRYQDACGPRSPGCIIPGSVLR